MVDHFVDEFLTREGESVEEARARLKAEQDARMEKQKAMNVAAEARRKAGLGE